MNDTPVLTQLGLVTEETRMLGPINESDPFTQGTFGPN